jgi:multidrug efflux system outer membrane protein
MSATLVVKLVGQFVDSVVATLIVLLVVGCKVGPDYKRPSLDIPGSYRQSLAPDIAPTSPAPSIADEQWTTVFQDPTLQLLIKEALANNLDLRIAAQRVLESQAQVGIARSEQLPSINGSVGYSALQAPSSLVGTNNNGTLANSFFRGGGPSASAAWNLDFWGLYRRQSEAARADLLASEWGQRATRTILIQSVAEAYFALRSLDSQLAITQNTIKARQDSLKLTETLEQHGAGSLADVRQAEELLHGAQANLPDLRRQIAIQENTISVLLGHNPEAIDRGLSLEDQPHPEQIPVGVPSELLERRPDVQQAEAKRAHRCRPRTVLSADIANQPRRRGKQPVDFNRQRTHLILVRSQFHLGAHLRWWSHPQ